VISELNIKPLAYEMFEAMYTNKIIGKQALMQERFYIITLVKQIYRTTAFIILPKKQNRGVPLTMSFIQHMKKLLK
jgi:uncharacterized membrane protein YoaT (DUF817 family)